MPAGTFRRFDELDSTNRWAVEHSAQFAEDQLPVVVLAERQTSGRGRGDRSWHADGGTLTFSLLDSLRRLQLQRATAARLALVAGLSVAEAIEQWLPPLATRIKWPNDVYVAGGKVCGILVETAGVAAERVVIGIGVNVSTDLSAAPEEVRLRARALASVVNRPLRNDELLEIVLERFDENVAQLGNDFPSLVSSVRSRCMLSGHRVTLRRGGQSLGGWCRGIDDTGALQIDDGRSVHRVESGEIVRFDAS